MSGNRIAPRVGANRPAFALRMLIPLTAIMLATGCTATVSGAAKPAANLVPQPLTGEKIDQVLPNQAQARSQLHREIKRDPKHARSGGIPDMPEGAYADPRSGPRECLGIAFGGEQDTYSNSDVQGYAQTEWEVATPQNQLGDVLWLEAAVVGLPTSADADALFDKFTQQWKRCNGGTQNHYEGDRESVWGKSTVNDVRSTDSVLAATVQITLICDRDPRKGVRGLFSWLFGLVLVPV